MKKAFLFLWLLSLFLPLGVAMAQSPSKSHTISGYVTDGKSQETLLGASVYDATTMKGAVTNNFGYYTLKLVEGQVDFRASFVGFEPYQASFVLKNDTVINSQERAILQLSVITVMLCATAEARFHFGIARFRVYAAVCLCAVMSVIVACVPNFLLTAFWMIPFSAETVFCVLQVALAAYMLSRLISIVRSEPEE